MTALITLAAICLFTVGALAGITGVVALAIRREDQNATLTREAPDPVTRAGRRLNGLHVRAPSGRLCGLIYAAARQTRIKVWAAMVAAVLVSRPQKV